MKAFAFIAAVVLVTATLAVFINTDQTSDDAALGTWDGSIATAFGGGDGSEGDPFVISSAEELAFLAQRVNASDTAFNDKHYILTADIYLNDVSSFETWGETAPLRTWTPIGNSSAHVFKGHFDGNGFTVFGIYVSATTEFKGLFGHVETAVIQNLGVEQSYIRGGERVGGIVGYAHNESFIINCYNAGHITGNARVGGVVGQLYNNSFMTNCYNTGPVTGIASDASNIGGVAGIVNVKSGVYNSFNTGSVVTADRGGGIVGQLNDSDLMNSYNTGTVTGIRVGGVVGNTLIGSTVSNSYNIGTVVGASGGSVIGTTTNSDTVRSFYLNTLMAPIGNATGDGPIGVDSQSFTSTGELTDKTYFDTLLQALNDWVNDVGNVHPIAGMTYSTWFQEEFPIFTDISFSASVTVVGGIGGTASVTSPGASAYYAGGTQITVTITPEHRYGLVSVTDNGIEVNAVNNNNGTFSYSFMLNTDHTILVTFVHDDDLSVSVTVVGGIGGTASITSPGNPPYANNTEVTVTITPDFGYIIGTVMDNVSDVTSSVIDNMSGMFSYTFTVQETDHIILVTFAPEPYWVTVIGGAGGAVSVTDPPYADGMEVTVTIVPHPGHRIKSITDNGNNIPLSAIVNNGNGTFSYTFTVSENHNIEVLFEIIPPIWVSVTVVGGVGGTASVTSPAGESFDDGTNITVTITPDVGYRLGTVTDNISNVTSSVIDNTDGTFSYTFTAKDGINHIISVSFNPISPVSVSVTVVGGAGGTASVSPVSTLYSYGTSVTVTITPAPGYEIGAVTDNGSDVISSLTDNSDGTFSYTFTTQDNNRAIVVSFLLSIYSVDVNAGANGTADAPDLPYTYGTSVTVTIIPEHGYTVGTIFNGAANVTASVVNNMNGTFSYTFTVQGDHTISVTFAALPPLWVSVTVTGETGGTASVSPAGGYTEGDDVTITITPESGFNVGSITNNGAGMDISALVDNGDGTFSYTFKISENSVIAITFWNDSSSCCLWILLVLLLIIIVLIICRKYVEDEEDKKK